MLLKSLSGKSRPDLQRHANCLHEWLELANLHGLEIGPLDKPLVDRDAYSVRYVDQFTQDELKRRCAANPNRDENNVVKLDYVLHERSLLETIDEQFDYVVASHVIEHVPNLIGWLRELSNLLLPGGALFVVVPDRHYTFDIGRPATTVGQFIESDLTGRTRPGIGAAFDQRFYHRNVASAKLWREPSYAEEVALTFTPEQALELARKADQRYVDCHCSVFDPASFDTAITVACDLSLQPFELNQLQPTERPYLDFIALLKRRSERHAD